MKWVSSSNINLERNCEEQPSLHKTTLTQFAHQFFQLVDDGDNAAECNDSRVIIWFTDNSHWNFSQIVRATTAVIRARGKYANVLLTKIGKLYLILFEAAVDFTIINVKKCLSWLQIQLPLVVGCHLLRIPFLNSLIKRKTLVDFCNILVYPLPIQKWYCFLFFTKSDNDKFDVRQIPHSPTMQTSWIESQAFVSTKSVSHVHWLTKSLILDSNWYLWLKVLRFHKVRISKKIVIFDHSKLTPYVPLKTHAKVSHWTVSENEE